ncbi:uncharacterized protein LOC132550006 [Ylistrum balloti]|uniref:uncharacterized protein LOC132550006 n=1 Tax=Ylistrum balloti TaxID=509963 RepID=UPI002905E576|nr:uncharacterized protein LOC132550006 [Ylistrum balloti]
MHAPPEKVRRVCKPCLKRNQSFSKFEEYGVNIGRAEFVCIKLRKTNSEKSPENTKSEIAEYRDLADKIQDKVYNCEHSAPNDGCLRDCKEFISYKLQPIHYGLRFAIYEGQADTMRTCGHQTEELYKHPIYQCLKVLAPHTPFPSIAMMIYRFRYAAALTVSGFTEDAKKEADIGKKKLQSFLNDTSMARINASCLYGYVNVQLARLERNPTKEQVDYILEWINKGLEQVKEIPNGLVSNLWARMFLVKKSFLLLRIGLSGEDIYDEDNEVISCEDREAASQCLKEADEHWTNTDKRRIMLYKRAEAKIRWLGGDKKAALIRLQEAIELATHFKREEKNFQQIHQKWAS